MCEGKSLELGEAIQAKTRDVLGLAMRSDVTDPPVAHWAEKIYINCSVNSFETPFSKEV